MQESRPAPGHIGSPTCAPGSSPRRVPSEPSPSSPDPRTLRWVTCSEGGKGRLRVRHRVGRSVCRRHRDGGHLRRGRTAGWETSLTGVGDQQRGGDLRPQPDDWCADPEAWNRRLHHRGCGCSVSTAGRWVSRARSPSQPTARASTWAVGSSAPSPSTIELEDREEDQRRGRRMPVADGRVAPAPWVGTCTGSSRSWSRRTARRSTPRRLARRRWASTTAAPPECSRRSQA